MKCLLFGLGQMGMAIKFAMEKLGFEVITNDLNNPDADFQEDANRIEGNPFVLGNHSELPNVGDKASSVDIVISALPYFCNEKVAKWAIDRKIPYCDLGGHVGTSEAINRYAEEKQSYVFTDLGLAPGWINIIATQGALELGRIDDVENIQMYVGGLPKVHWDNPLSYHPSWSLDGLLNEYRDDCEYLKDGEVSKVAGMSEVESVQVPLNRHHIERMAPILRLEGLVIGEDLTNFEAFNTSGGLAHTLRFCKDKGIKNCSYKTLRHKGHAKIMSWLLENLEDNEIIKLLGETTREDEVWMHVKITGVNGFKFEYSNRVGSDERFTAMQKCTAFPLASAASLVSRRYVEEGFIKGNDYSLGYEMLCNHMAAFNANLHTLGIEGNTLL